MVTCVGTSIKLLTVRYQILLLRYRASLKIVLPYFEQVLFFVKAHFVSLLLIYPTKYKSISILFNFIGTVLTEMRKTNHQHIIQHFTLNIRDVKTISSILK